MGYNVPSLKTAHEPWEAYALEVLVKFWMREKARDFKKKWCAKVRSQMMQAQATISMSLRHTLHAERNTRRSAHHRSFTKSAPRTNPSLATTKS